MARLSNSTHSTLRWLAAIVAYLFAALSLQAPAWASAHADRTSRDLQSAEPQKAVRGLADRAVLDSLLRAAADRAPQTQTQLQQIAQRTFAPQTERQQKIDKSKTLKQATIKSQKAGGAQKK